MNKTSKNITLGLAVLLVIILAIFFLGNAYFYNRFYERTQIAGIDVSAMTMEEAKQELQNKLLQSNLKITENGQEVAKIPLSSFAEVNNAENIVRQAKNQQNKDYWFEGFFKASDYTDSVKNELSIKQEQFESALAEAGIKNEDRKASENAKIAYQKDEGYQIQEAVQGQQVNWDQLASAAQDSLTIELADHYLQPEIKVDDPELQERLKEIDQITQTKIILTIEDQDLQIPKEKIQEWLIINEDGSFAMDKEAIYDYLGDLNLEYATYAKERQLESTYSGTVTVQPKILGWHIDRKAETEQLAKELLAGKDVKRDPNIKGNNYGLGTGFGSNYVEVDIAKQKLMIYKNNEKVFETDVITGRPGSETPVGASYVWNKSTQQTLRGFNVHTQEDYETPVAYWVAITDDNLIGLHDAPWQYKFGGDSRLTHGSLGCINIAPSVMGEVFNLTELEMPVAVF